MNKDKALQNFFITNPAQVQLLELHRDGWTSTEKAAERGCKKRTVKNQQGAIIKIFGVNDMNQAVHHAMYHEIIAPKRHRRRPAPRPKPITRQWSPDLQHYHRKYIEGLTRAQKRELGL